MLFRCQSILSDVTERPQSLVRRQDTPLVSSDDSESAMGTAMIDAVAPKSPASTLLLFSLLVSSPPAQEQVTQPPLFYR